jgi:hypothetical protein
MIIKTGKFREIFNYYNHLSAEQLINGFKNNDLEAVRRFLIAPTTIVLLDLF